MPERISLHLKSSYLLLILAVLSSAVILLGYALLVYYFFLSVTVSLSGLIAFAVVAFLLVFWLYSPLPALHRLCAESHITLRFDDGTWWMNNKALSQFALLHRSGFGLLVKVKLEEEKRARVVWLSTQLSGQAGIRRLSRCFKA